MKILIVCDDISTFGGIERVVANLGNAFIKRGNAVTIYTFNQSHLEIPYPLDKDIVLVSDSYVDFNFNTPKTSLEKVTREVLRVFYKGIWFFKRLKRDIRFNHFVQKLQPDIVLCNEFASANKILKAPSKYIDRFFRIIHGNMASCRLFSLKYFRHIILLTSKELQDYKAKYSKAKISVIPNFLPEIPEINTDYTQKVVVSVGRMDYPKGFLRLVDIWNLVLQNPALKEWKLHIVGDGDLKPQIEAKIQELNLQDSIVLKPFTKTIEKEYLSTSIYVMASHFEGFGMVLAEAASFGLPLIAFDIKTGPSDIIENNISGYLIQDNDLKTYAKKLESLMLEDNLRKTFGQEAKRIVKEKFSQEVVMRQWEVLLNKI